jgi:class 3 adenylate cyclase
MTTENVAVLFTDMVGSTALASSRAADAADELRRYVGWLLRGTVRDGETR